MSFNPLQSRLPAGPLIAALGLSAAAVSALAQASPAASASPDSASAAPGAWTSAFEGYVPSAPAQPVPWREANEQVGRIGGWRAYAREAQAAMPPDGAAGAGTVPASPVPALPAASPASTPAAHRH